MEKCFIVRYTLGKTVWFLVEQGGMVLSTPFQDYSPALQWVRKMTGCKTSIRRMTSDVIEVTLQGAVC